MAARPSRVTKEAKVAGSRESGIHNPKDICFVFVFIYLSHSLVTYPASIHSCLHSRSDAPVLLSVDGGEAADLSSVRVCAHAACSILDVE